MKKSASIIYTIFPLIITLSLYLVFNSRIASKPSDAGFWFILALGISIGVILTRIAQSAGKK
jgi:hypothetical protein